MDVIIGISLSFALGFAGLAMLVFSARYARSMRVCVSWGILAGLFMLLQCVLFGWMADFNNSFSPGVRGYGLAKTAGFFFIISLLVYLFFIVGKFKDRK
jgi:hypothetical protein